MIRLAFQGAEQVLDTPVLPRAAKVAELLTNTGQTQRRSEYLAGKHALVSLRMACGLPKRPMARNR